MGRRLPDQPPVDLDAECHHARRHEHGEQRTYYRHTCRCRPCRDAAAAEVRRRYRLGAYGRPAEVPAMASRDHINRLRAEGMTIEQIARAAGRSTSVIGAIVYGAPDMRIHSRTANAILAAEPAADDRRVDPRGALRRVQALACIGWPPDAVLGTSIHQAIGRRQTISRELHDRVCDAYERLWDQPAPESTRAKRLRLHAKRMGWAPPMAWDDIDHDDAPAEVEDDKGRVHPDDLAWMLRTERTSWAAADRLGISREYALTLAARHGIEVPAHIRVNDADRTQMAREGRLAA